MPNAPYPVIDPSYTASFMEGVIVRPWRDGWVEVDGAQRAALKTAPREKP